MVVSNIFYFHPLFGEDFQFDSYLDWMGGNHQPAIFSRFMTCFFEALDRLVEKMRPAPLVWHPRDPPIKFGVWKFPQDFEAGGPKIVASSEMVETYWFVFKEKVSKNSCFLWDLDP